MGADELRELILAAREAGDIEEQKALTEELDDAGLTPGQRNAWVSCRLNGLPVAEYAARHGVTVKTVEDHIAAAEEKL